MTQPPQPPPGVVRYGAGLPTPTPKKKTPAWVIAVIVVAVCCGGAVIMGAINTIVTGGKTPTSGRQNTDRPAAQAAPDPTLTAIVTSAPPAVPPPPPSPAGPATSFGTGMYEVGVDIKAGTYTCTAGSLGGYWERAKNASGEFSAIIANDAFDGKSIVTVKVKEFFKVTNAECVAR